MLFHQTRQKVSAAFIVKLISTLINMIVEITNNLLMITHQSTHHLIRSWQIARMLFQRSIL